MKRLFVIVVGIIIVGAVYWNNFKPEGRDSASINDSADTEQDESATDNDMVIVMTDQEITPPLILLNKPLSSAHTRVTKKQFGIKISPQESPVSPERFSGYHTGVDFEILPGEEDEDVIVAAICSGPLIFINNSVSGYGGVVAQTCTVEKQEVTVIYGHIRVGSIKHAINSQLKAGETFAVLGSGYSSETDGERKHLHLGIYKGTEGKYLLGYVSNESSLSGWLNILDYLP